MPSSIGSCRNLNLLDLAENNLTGTIPRQIIGISSQFLLLNLSQNSFIGPIPLEVSKLKNTVELDVSENRLSGEIPQTIADCQSIETLNMQGNFLQGVVPSSLASLRGLKHLDLSRNKFSGKIQKELGKLMFLLYLNVSFNNLSGEVPKRGVFSNVSALFLIGNNNLCGGNPKLLLPECSLKQKKQKSPIVIILATTLGSIAFLVTIAFLCFFRWRKARRNPASTSFHADSLPQISYQELLQVTGGFSSDNFIGQGSFGLVYRGNLNQQAEKLIAVKVFKLHQHEASKSFVTECRVLRNTRHRNLVKVLTYCSSIDFKGSDFKALVFNFLANESLDTWLHDGNDQSRCLNLLQRLQIAIDVAFALHYLHDNCEESIIHCDLKPSNILLDDNMTAHVGDFGLARLWTASASSQGQTSSVGMKGTIGYVAPEYGVGNAATMFGDTYSFGIILLGMFTGKRPTDEVFTNGSNLHNFVKSNLSGTVTQVVDPTLLTMGDTMTADKGEEMIQEHDGCLLKCIVSVLEIGVACSAELPEDRMNMRDAFRKLNVTKDGFLCASTNTDHRRRKYQVYN